MAQRQTTLQDLDSTEVRTENEETTEDDEEKDVFSPRRRRQLRAAGVDLDAARRVKEAEEGKGQWWPAAATEEEQHYVQVRSTAHLYLPAGDMSHLSWGGIR